MGQTESFRKKREMRAELGLCRECDAPPAPGRKQCEKHLLAAREVARRVRQKRQQAGLCYQCGKRPPEPGRAYCKPCVNRICARMYYPDSSSGVSLNGNRIRVLERDQFTCQLCRANPTKTIHHIDGSGWDQTRRRPAKGANNTMENLITLCTKCHDCLERFLSVDPNLELLCSLLSRTPLPDISRCDE